MSKKQIIRVSFTCAILVGLTMTLGLIFNEFRTGIFSGIAGVAMIIATQIAIPFDGRIIANYKDPKKDTYRLELGIPFGELDRRKSVIFKIEKE